MPTASWESFKKSQFTTSQIKRLDKELSLTPQEYFEAVKLSCHPDLACLQKTLVVLGLSSKTSALYQEIEKAITSTRHREDFTRGTIHCHLNVGNIFDAASDCLWYVFTTIYAFDLDLEFFFRDDSFRWEGMEVKSSSAIMNKIIDNLNYSAKIAGLYKKVYGYNKPFSDIKVNFARNLFLYRLNLQSLAFNMDFTLEDCAKHKLSELHDFYPNELKEKK